jgi:calcium-dependent protein kinase
MVSKESEVDGASKSTREEDGSGTTVSPVSSPKARPSSRLRVEVLESFDRQFSKENMARDDGLPEEDQEPDSPTLSEIGSPRRAKKRECRKIPITATMGFTASKSLQLVVDKTEKNVADFYNLKGKIGEGSYGKVRAGEVKATGALRALKTISKNRLKDQMGILKTEIDITKTVDHPNLIKLYEIFEDEHTICLVLELCTGGHLAKRVDEALGLKDKDAAICMQQVLRGVYYMHKNGIMHRDLKPANVLFANTGSIEKNTLKVSDFGLSMNFKPGVMYANRAGTTKFMAPEVIDGKYDYRCDLWSCGVILFFVLCGSVPFYGKGDEQIFRRIKRGKVVFDDVQWEDRSRDAKKLISALLCPVKERCTIKVALEASFFTKHLPAKPNMTIPQNTLENLRNYRTLNKFKRSALSVVASLLPEEKIKGSKDIFLHCDMDGDGTMSLGEFRDRLIEVWKTEKSIFKGLSVEEVLATVFVSKAGDDVLQDFTYTEFLAATFDRRYGVGDAILKAAFTCFDKNSDGSISMAELTAGRLLGHLSIEELAQIFSELDLNGDGSLDLDEFTMMMRQGMSRGSIMPSSPMSPKRSSMPWKTAKSSTSENAPVT